MSYKRFKYFHISKMKKIRFLSIKSSSKLCVIFLHGFMSNIEGEKPLNFAKFCHRKKINFLALEYSGHGKSYGKFTDGNISSWTNDAYKVIKSRFKDLNLIILYASFVQLEIFPSVNFPYDFPCPEYSSAKKLIFFL